MASLVAEPLATGLAFPECPRWHDGRLWCSDMHDGAVVTIDAATGRVRAELDVPGHPAGLGWLSDGRLLVVSMRDRQVLRRETDGTLAIHADLAALCPGWCNDMVVDARGNAYVGNYGFDVRGGAPRADTPLAYVEPSGAARLVGEPLSFPNGAVVTPDRQTLIVGESLGERLTAFAIADDGSLQDRRLWAQLESGARPDGACLDAEGALWVATYTTARVLRILEGGTVVDVVTVPGLLPFACALGGADGRTLFVCASPTWREAETVPARAGVVAALRVDVPSPMAPSRQ